MRNEREIYNFINTLQLENYVKELRIAHAKSYLNDKIDLRNLTEKDFIAIYTLLQTKDNENLQKRLDEIRICDILNISNETKEIKNDY